VVNSVRLLRGCLALRACRVLPRSAHESTPDCVGQRLALVRTVVEVSASVYSRRAVTGRESNCGLDAPRAHDSRMCEYPDRQRRSRGVEVIAEQRFNVVDRDADALAATHSIRDEALEMQELLVVGDIPGFAGSLRRGWEAKKGLASRIPNPTIERAYQVAESHGMVAGKVSGARCGGFLMMIVDPRRRIDVIRTIEQERGGSVAPYLFTKDSATSWRVPMRKSGQTGR
jgi:hypothetical protein